MTGRRHRTAGAEPTDLDGLEAARGRVLRTVTAMPARARRGVRVGEWSADDVLRHLLGWDRAIRRAIPELLRAEVPSFCRHYDADWRSFNSLLRRRYRRLAGRELIDALGRSHSALVRAASRIPAEERARDRGVRFRGWRLTISGLLRVEAHDELAHYRALRSALARWKRGGPLPARMQEPCPVG